MSPPRYGKQRVVKGAYSENFKESDPKKLSDHAYYPSNSPGKRSSDFTENKQGKSSQDWSERIDGTSGQRITNYPASAGFPQKAPGK